MRSFREIIKYIYWRRETKAEVLSAEDWKELYLMIKDAGEKPATLTRRNQWYAIADKGLMAYNVQVKGKYRHLYTYSHETGYHWYTTNDFDTSKDGHTGTDAIRYFTKAFGLTYGEGPDDKAAFRKAYGTTNEEFKNCVPKQFYWIDRSKCGKTLFNVSSIDDSSHYPAAACGLMPDSHTAQVFDGRVEPTKEYPFAFYLKSGHFKEYNGVDTQQWLSSKYATSLFDFKDDKKNPFLHPCADMTVLMKASPITMTRLWEALYQIKSEKPEAKLAMNATIGNWHRRAYRSYRYAHLATVAIARANDKMLKAIQLIGEERVIHVCVDGIIYIGDAVATKEKQLGKFVQEFSSCVFQMRGMNTYMAFENGVLVKMKHGAFNYNSDNTFIDDYPPTKFEDMYQWKRIDLLEDCI